MHARKNSFSKAKKLLLFTAAAACLTLVTFAVRLLLKIYNENQLRLWWGDRARFKNIKYLSERYVRINLGVPSASIAIADR